MLILPPVTIFSATEPSDSKGTIWYETDSNGVPLYPWAWVHNNNGNSKKWRSSTPVTLNTQGAPTTAASFFLPLPSQALAFMILSYNVNALAVNAQSGANLWNINLRTITTANTATVVSGASITTSAQTTANNWRNYTTSPNVYIDPTSQDVKAFEVRTTVTGTPGNLSFAAITTNILFR